MERALPFSTRLWQQDWLRKGANRHELYTDRVLAGLVPVIIIGLFIENVVFALIERLTVRRWGMAR